MSDPTFPPPPDFDRATLRRSESDPQIGVRFTEAERDSLKHIAIDAHLNTADMIRYLVLSNPAIKDKLQAIVKHD